MSGVSRRLAAGFGGQAYARASLFLNALVTIPVLLRVWGIETYGEWLALTSLASYLTLSNFGLSSAACMAMINAVAKDAWSEATRIFQVSLNVLFVAMLPIGFLLIGVASVLPVRHALHIVSIGQPALIAIISLILLQIIAMTVKGLYAGAINAAGRYGLPNYVSGTMKIVELGAIIAAVAFWRAMPVAVALISTVAGALDLALHVGLARSVSPWARIGVGAFDRALLQRLLKPSLGHATIYVAVNAVVVQGPRIALAAIAGPAAVAVFGIYATLVQSIAQITNLITPVLQLEFARNSGSEDNVAASREMLVHGSRFALANYFGVAAILLLASPFVVPVWTGHRVAFDAGLLGIMLAASFFTQFGRSALSYLMGHNAVFAPALVMLALGLGGLGIGSLLTPRLYVAGMATGFLLSESLTAAFLVVFSAGHLSTRLTPFLRDQFDLYAGTKELFRALKGGRDLVAAIRLKPSPERRA